MIVNAKGTVADAVLGGPESVLVVTLLDGTQVHSRGIASVRVLEAVGVIVLECSDRRVAIPVDRVKYAELMRGADAGEGDT